MWFIFHFIITIAVTFMGFSIVTQQVMINLLQSQIDQVPGIIKVSEENIKDWASVADVALKEKIYNTSETVNARIDTIDSAIKPNKKRRMVDPTTSMRGMPMAIIGISTVTAAWVLREPKILKVANM